MAKTAPKKITKKSNEKEVINDLPEEELEEGAEVAHDEEVAVVEELLTPKHKKTAKPEDIEDFLTKLDEERSGW